MISRRHIVHACAALLLAPSAALAQAAADPMAIVTAIYKLAARGKGE